MKVLVFNGYYLPAKNYGGPTTSLANMVAYCGLDADFFIVARNHDLGETEVFPGIVDGWNKVGNASVRYISDSEANPDTYFRIIEEVRPDAIWSVGMFARTTPKLFDYARKNHIAVIMSPRGAINKKAVAIKAYKKIPYLLYLRLSKVFKDVTFHVTSEDEFEGAKKYLGIAEKNIVQIPNLPSKPLEEKVIEKKEGFLRVAYVSRVNPTKNLLFAIECINRVKSDIVFDIYGSCEDKAYWEKCLAEIAKKPKNITVNYHGAVGPDKVAEIYSEHHCALLPTLTENYGHAIVEAMQNGCFVIIPKGTTPWDRIDQKSGFVINLDDRDKYVSALETLCAMDQEEYDRLRKGTVDYIQGELKTSFLKDEYLSMINEAVEREKC